MILLQTQKPTVKCFIGKEEMVTREDIEVIIDSLEILSNPKTMEALRKSDQDIKAGRVKEVLPPLKIY